MHVHVYSMHMHLYFSGGLPMGKFENKVVLITGGGGGIGKAAARRFLDEGASVVLAGTRAAVLDAAARRVELVAGRLEHRRPRAGEHDAGALVEEEPRRGLADAAAATRDDDHLAVEVH